MIRRTAIAAVALALLGIGSWLWFQRWGPSRKTYSSQGIDVSHHQGVIDWPRVKAAGANFAYIKASEGADHRDRAFVANWAAAGAAGLKRGAYHFFTLCTSGVRQGENFIALVPRDPEALPPAVDLEFGGNCAARPSRNALLADLRNFIEMAEAHSEKPIMLYVTREFEEAYRISGAIDRPLWLRRIFLEPDYAGHLWVMWQANPRRRVDGIDGPVDWNVVRGQ